jgi:hypothetical protein
VFELAKWILTPKDITKKLLLAKKDSERTSWQVTRENKTRGFRKNLVIG